MNIDIDDCAGTVMQLIDVKSQIAELKEMQTLLESKLKVIIGAGNTGTMNGLPVLRYSEYETTVFQQTKFKTENPDLAARYSTTETRTRFALVASDDNA